MFDVAAAPLLLTLIGVPLLLIAVIVVLIIVTVRLIKRARAKNIEAGKNQENDISSDEDL